MISSVHQVAWHRNGVGGEGFHAVVFDTETEHCAKCNGFATLGINGLKQTVCMSCGPTSAETSATRMVAIVFDGPGQVAVLDIAKLSDPAVGVAFGENSWRGDQYEAELRSAISTEDSDGSVRIGPFAVPTKRKAKP
jgi:hypothetical protein